MRKLFPPPYGPPLPVPYPEFTPPFHDQDPPDYPQACSIGEDVAHDGNGEPDEIPASFFREATDAGGILQQHKIVELLGKRHQLLGTVTKKIKGQPERDHVIVIVYNYTDDTVVEARFRGTEFLGVDVSHAQPSLHDDEIRRAEELVGFAERVPESERCEASTIGVTRLDPGDPLFQHRLADVRFGKPDERVPRYAALVDLSAEKVISFERLSNE